LPGKDIIVTDEIPPLPAIRTSELYARNTPYALLPSARHTVGWLQTSDDTTIPLAERARFVTIRRSAMGTYKVVSTYPLTKDGWQQACQELSALEPSAMPMLRKVLAQRIEDDARLSNEPAAEPAAPQVPARSSPEVRARILQMFKRGNRKYAKPFEQDRLAMVSVMGGNWEEYGQVVLQMAILDTLLSIEELLRGDDAKDGEDAAEE
jgi:hypothetical protein